MKKLSGSITIYFVFAILLIISVVLSVTEIARINCQKLYLQIATDASIDSMASLYHRKLYEYYNLYGVEYRTVDLLETEYLSYMYPFFRSEDAVLRNWYIANIDEENVDLKIRELVDETYLEKEILNYMDYKLIGKVVEFLGKEIFIEKKEDENKLVEEAESIFKEAEKSDLYNEIYERYFDFAGAIRTLEDYAKKISDYVNKVNLSLNGLKSMSTSGSKSNAETVSRKINELNDRINNLYNNLLSYKNKMNDFRNTVNESYLRYKNDVASGKYEFDDDIIAFIESEFQYFIDFVDEDSEMNKAVDLGFENCDNMSSIISEHNESINDYVSQHIDLENQLKEERNKRGDDRDTEEIAGIREEIKDLESEISDYLKDIKDTYKEMKMEQIDIEVSNGNKSSEESLLKKLTGFKNGVLLNLILDSDVISNISSDKINYNNFNIMSKNNSISIDKIILGEYEIDKFNYFNKELNGKKTNSGSTKYEVERLISGYSNDMDSIKDVVNKILLIRIAMNVLHIYKSAEKRQLARNFAMVLFSGISLLLAEAMFLLIITAWGTAQSIVDLQNLMKNNRVKFMHDNESWTVSVDSILDFARDRVVGDERDDGGFALNYEDYLRILLATTRQSDINARMVSIIDRNIKDEQESFDFEKLVYSFYVENKFICKHFFTNFVFVPAKDISLYDQYAITTNAYRCFYDNKE